MRSFFFFAAATMAGSGTVNPYIGPAAFRGGRSRAFCYLGIILKFDDVIRLTDAALSSSVTGCGKSASQRICHKLTSKSGQDCARVIKCRVENGGLFPRVRPWKRWHALWKCTSSKSFAIEIYPHRLSPSIFDYSQIYQTHLIRFCCRALTPQNLSLAATF